MGSSSRVAARASAAFAAASIALSSSSAIAQVPSSPPRLTLGSDVRFWSSEPTGTSFPVVPFAHFEVIPRVFLDADLPIAPQSGGDTFGPEQDPKSRFGLGNPMLGAHVETAERGSPFVFFAGLRIGLPLASVGDIDGDRANDIASAANAHADFYHWVPELFPIASAVGFEARPSSGFWIRLPVELTFLIPTTDRRTFHGGVITRLEMEGRGSKGLGGGGSLSVVVSDGFRTRNRDRAQSALEPYIVYDTGRFFFRFGVITALDGPLGPGVGRGGLVGANVRVGGGLF